MLWLCSIAAAMTPLSAQTTQIGGGTCTSASVSGNYAVSITGRKVTSASNFTAISYANGVANFDGLNKVTLSLVSDTFQSIGTPQTWSGTYTMQANCLGTLTISSGGSASFTLLSYNSGRDFLLVGADTNYSYNGNGSLQPAACPTATISGVYTVNLAGYPFTATAVSGLQTGGGAVQFDGKGNVTASLTLYTAGPTINPITLNGTYSISNCIGSGTLSDGKGNTYTIAFSVTGLASGAASSFTFSLGQNGKLILNGTARPAFGQPTSALLPAAALGVRS